ncbi:MAG: tRNA threonylcarbamoyladenosine dehydratase [Firmicutes bacterium ADurb.Bin182]|nr:MAG: tRNA threonylcarbamoyladenosine dehydratase [Firmicutes bacterium ADurb.Bin182]
MPDRFSRTELLLGKAAMELLQSSRVAVFGIGGVGSFAAEALARSGIGSISLIDDDKICLTNINRQLIAATSTIGKQKTDVMKARIQDINPKACVEVYPMFYTSDNADTVDLTRYDYILDAIDTVSSKLVLIERATAANVPIISCMGAGNKLDPTRFEVADIYSTSVCPLAKAMRNELRKRGIKSLKVVYSKEPPLKPLEPEDGGCKKICVCPADTKRKCTVRRQIPGSASFVPSVAGLIMAGETVKDLIHLKGRQLFFC